MFLPCSCHVLYVCVDQGVPLIALQECGPKGAEIVRRALGAEWQYFSGATEDPVSTFWNTTVPQ